MLAQSHSYFHKAADVLGLSDTVRTVLLTPRRSVKVEIVIEGEAGNLQVYTGHRVQHNMARGPMKGGLRYHPAMDEDHVAAQPRTPLRSPNGPFTAHVDQDNHIT